MKRIRINAPEYYGNAQAWAAGQIVKFNREHKGTPAKKCEPIVKETAEGLVLEAIVLCY